MTAFQPLKVETEFKGDAVAEFDRRVQEQIDAGATRQEAIDAVVLADADLNLAQCQATNESSQAAFATAAARQRGAGRRAMAKREPGEKVR